MATNWKPEDVEFIFRSYQIFEKKFEEFLRVLPLTPENEKAWSPELVGLFLDISSMVDSVARHIVGKSAAGKPYELNINDFEKTLLTKERIIDSRVAVYVYPLKVISPYDGYREADGWWKVYSSLKHNRIEHYTKANLANTLNALASLFLILVRHKDEEFTKALLRFNLINDTGLVPEYLHGERIRNGYQFWYDSELFGTHDLAENLPKDISKINPALTSRKFQKFFGRFNP
ncbi:MAG: hypothetical protein Q8P01_03625 [bacterium]|nr:hypothetical protein [bacterium]